MNDQYCDDLDTRIGIVAEKAIQMYAQGVLLPKVLAEHIAWEWGEIQQDSMQPSHDILMRLAQRICSRELYYAWRASDDTVRNNAFANIRRYLECSLAHTHYASSLRDFAHAREDVLQQTLEILLASETRGPDDPAAFLRWVQTILLRQASTFVQKLRREASVSLEGQMEFVQEKLVWRSDDIDDLAEHVALQELRQALSAAILSLRNPNYRMVLLHIYLAGISIDELAHHFHVNVQDIYLWRHRALKALRHNQEIMRILRSFLE